MNTDQSVCDGCEKQGIEKDFPGFTSVHATGMSLGLSFDRDVSIYISSLSYLQFNFVDSKVHVNVSGAM
jgi:hypothetical protein